MSARAGSKGRSQSVRLSMVSVSTDDRDSAAPEPPERETRWAAAVAQVAERAARRAQLAQDLARSAPLAARPAPLTHTPG